MIDQDTADTVLALLGRARAALAAGNGAGALQHALQAQAAAPGSFDVLYTLGMVHGSLGHLGEAIDCLERALQACPDNALACHALASARRMGGDLESAERGYRDAIRCDPAMCAAHNDLGVLLQVTGRGDLAVQSYRRALEIDPQKDSAAYNLGLLLHEAGDDVGAAPLLEQVLARNPGHAEACNTLARVRSQLQQHDEAAGLLRRALQLRPDYADAWFNLALELLDHFADYPAAEDAARRALALDPASYRFHCMLGRVLREAGRFDDAIELFRKAMDIDPDMPDARIHLSGILERRAHVDEGMALLSPLLEQRPPDPDAAIAYAALAGALGEQAEAVDLLGQALSLPDMTDEKKRHLNFSLAKLLEDTGQYDLAFAHFREGNECRNASFDPAAIWQLVEQLMQTFPMDADEQLASAARETSGLVFIVGMPRSGTSLVEQILASHTQVFGCGELSGVNNLALALQQTLQAPEPYPLLMHRLDSDTAARLQKEYLDALPAEARAAICSTDKMPQNFLHLGLIRLLFPGARVIHCKRDPLDTCVSCYSQDFRGYHPWSCDLGWLGEYYAAYDRLMQHWEQLPGLNMLQVRYEQLVQDQQGVTREMLAFCGLDWEQACLDFHRQRRDVHTASYGQVRQPLYTGSVEKWKRYAAWLGPLREALERHAR